MLLTAAQEDWHFTCTSANQSKRSLEWKAQKLSAFIAFCNKQGITQVEEVTTPLVHRFIVNLPDSFSDYTKHGYAQVVKTFLNYCAREEWISEKVAKRIQMPRVTQRVIQTFTPAQITRLLEATSHEVIPALRARDRAIIAVLYDTGIRASELCGLTLNNVHLQGDDPYILVLGKGRKERQVGLGEQSRRELHRYIFRHREAPAEQKLVFLNRNGRRLNPGGLDQMLYRLRNWAGIQGIRVSAHSFRHSFACSYLASGGDVYKLSRLLGHTNVTTTENYLRAFSAVEARRGGISVFDGVMKKRA